MILLGFMFIPDWISNNYIEIFGAVTGILYVILEIRQNIWLWPVGIITSGVYIWIFFTGKLYADMSLQGYYLVVSVLGWYWWVKGAGRRAQGTGERKNEDGKLNVTRLSMMNGIILTSVFIVLFFILWLVLSKLTDSPVPVCDSFITSLSIIATWMLARKIYEHWYLWIIVNTASIILFFTRGLYPTVILYIVYCAMSFAGLKEWGKSLKEEYK